MHTSFQLPSSTPAGASTTTAVSPEDGISYLSKGATPQQEVAGDHTRQDAEDAWHERSRVVHLTPPPVVRRPPKYRTDKFHITSLPFLTWSWSEHKELAHCARSVHISYNETTTLRLFGIKFSKNTVVKTSEHGIESAHQVINLGSRQWVHDKREHIRARMHGHNGKQAVQSGEGGPTLDSEAEAKQQSSAEDVERQLQAHKRAPTSAHPWLFDHHYVVVGFMGDERVPKERLRRVMDEEALFQQIRHAYRRIRKPLRRIMSLKTVCGFGVYECDPTKGYHREVEVDRDTERALAELWRDYCGHKLDYQGRWLLWIHENFNNGSNNPEHGRLALEFKLHWSVYKVVFWGFIPVLLSLAIGFWYMYKDHGDIDHIAVAEAAWVIASYIVTTSALLLALLAVITQFGSI